MALLAPDPPHQAAEAVQSTFRAFAEHRSFRSPALRKATGSLQLVEPHQVFTLGLADLVAGRGLEAADLLVPLAPSPVDAPAGHPVPAARLLEELASKARPVAPVGPADRTGG